MKNNQTKQMVRIALFMAVTILLAATPLGYVYIPVIGLSLTIMVLPVVMGGALLGMPAGIILGLTFGVTSLLKAPAEALGQLLLAYSPFVTAVICIVPRILVGVAAALFGRLLARKERYSIYALSGAVCSLVNTVFFVGLIYLFCRESVEGAFGILVWSTTLDGGLGEAALAAVLCAAVMKPLRKIIKV